MKGLFRIFNGYGQQGKARMNQRSRRDFLFSVSAVGAPIAIAPALLGQKRQKDVQSDLHGELTQLLAIMPAQPKPVFTVLETVARETGTRYKIEFLSEPPHPVFNTPADIIRAYLFVPDHREGRKIPAIMAIHQDGPQSHIGKSEPAGLAGDKGLFYGLELFQKGYVVLWTRRASAYYTKRNRVGQS